MEELRGHRRPTKSSFGHVHSAPFPAKSDAYGEIFDEMANSCSIPFLDLPPPVESFDGGSIGYSEIFCGVKGGDFAVDYEELSKKGVESLDSSSGSYSASSADVPYLDAPCVRTSDIKLQTKPSRVAPPTKNPPKIIHKQENTKMEMPRSSIGDQEGNLLKPARNHQIRYKLGAPKSRGFQTSDFLDVEVDTGSAAAASVAAMKEAMEQAHARLKRAKELMERQRYNNETWKKLGHRDGTRYDERKDAKAFEEIKNFRGGTPNKTLPKKDKEMKDHAFDELQKITEVGKAPSDHEEGHADAVTAAGSLQMRQGNGFKSSEMRSKLEELCGEWKAEEKFYEIVNNEKKISTVKEGEQEDAEKKLKTTTKISEVKERYSEEDGLAYEFNRTVGLHTVNTPVEKDEIGENLNACNMTSKKEISKTPEKTRDACALKDSLSSDYQDVNQKLHAAYEAVVGGEELTKPNTGKKASCGETEMDVRSCDNTSKIGEAQDRAENKDIGGVKQVSRAEKEDIIVAAQEACLKSCSSSHDAVGTLGTVVTENSSPAGDRKDNLEREISIEREYEKEQARKAKEEKEMERGRDEDRLAVERATREAHERSVSEAQERAERIAVERATAETRQRSLKEACGKAQKASAEALEKSSLEKALKEAKLRAERAAIERATAEARERAVEKAIAEKAAADARRRAERLTAISRDKSRKDNEAGSGMGDSGIKLRASSSDVLHDASFQCTGSSGSSQIYADSTAYGEEESPLRCKARSERHQRTVERAAKALAEKNSFDVVAQREQEERNRFAELLDADVRRWSAGKEGNLRALLSTLQYILGPESGWQSIPLTDVITAAAVKKAYRKATLFVHPDKLQQRGASIQQKYICEKVFDLLKEAWNKFNSDEER